MEVPDKFWRLHNEIYNSRPRDHHRMFKDLISVICLVD